MSHSEEIYPQDARDPLMRTRSGLASSAVTESAIHNHPERPGPPGPSGEPTPEQALSIVLPCFNEAANVERVLTDAHRHARALAAEFEIVVVDDGSSDGTAERVMELGLDAVVIVRHETNRGYGAALRSGFRAARYPWVFYTDGDGQFGLDQLTEFVSGAPAGTVLAGYRSPRADGSLIRLLNGRGWTKLTNAALGLSMRDVNCAFKLFPKSLLQRVPMSSRGAAIDAEILLAARLNGVPIVQRPVRHQPRTHGRATGARLPVIGLALWELAKLRARAS